MPLIRAIQSAAHQISA